MDNQFCLALIASSIFVTGLPGCAVAQVDGSQLTGAEAIQRAILAARYGQNPRLMFPQPAKPPFFANRGLPLYRPQVDSSANGAASAAGAITFDVPGAVLGTYALGIDPAGAITGFYGDASGVVHGFLRTPDGSLTTLDAPGATYTLASAIDPAGTITGHYFDANFNLHGFVRAAGGAFTTFDVPGAVNGTQPIGINPSGTTTGLSFDSNGVNHGFLRTKDGTITSFDLPGPGIVNLSGIINPAGTVTGYYFDNNPPIHSFVRDLNGTLTTFDGPNVCQTSNGTFATGIDPAGVVVGVVYDAGCANFHGFIRSSDGAFTIIDFPGAQATEFDAINPAGEISGLTFLSGGISNFLRAPDGTFTTFSIPESSNGFGIDTAINPAGTITGYYFDANGVAHGFVRKKE